MATEQGKTTEIPFSYSLKEIARSVIIDVTGLTKEDVGKKRKIGFFVGENRNWPIKKIAEALRATHDFSVTEWARRTQSFEYLIQLIATDNPILREETDLTESELRFILYVDAQSEISNIRTYFAKKTLFENVGANLSDEELQVKMQGLETFQQKLLARKA